MAFPSASCPRYAGTASSAPRRLSRRSRVPSLWTSAGSGPTSTGASARRLRPEDRTSPDHRAVGQLPPAESLGVRGERQLHEFDGLRAGVDTRHLGVDPPPDHARGVAGDTTRAVGIVGPHHDRRHTGDRSVLDLILQVLGDLALVIQAALLKPEPGDVDQAAGVGRLPAADRADEGALNVLWIGAYRLGQDVGGQYLAFLLQVRVLLLGVVVARHVVAGARFFRGAAHRSRAAGQYQ